MNNNDFLDKKIYIDTIKTTLKQYQQAYSMYFVTLTFKSRTPNPFQPSEYQIHDYDYYFRLFKNRLNKLSLRHSKQRNKCILFAFPEKSYHHHNPLLKKYDKLLNNDNRQSNEKTNKAKRCRNRNLPNHYHCTLLIHNQHKDRFERKCITQSSNEVRSILSENLSNPYPKSIHNHEDNLIVQDTDIQEISDLEPVINYSTKNLLYSDFKYDHFYDFVSKN
jgi:hypothetical protein